MDRVVYYARVSTEEEQQASALQIQCFENEEFISAHENWEMVDKYVDEGKSGTTTAGRLEFQRMINDMEEDKFDIILIKQIDRGWRNLTDWKIFEEILVRNRKRLFIRLRNEYYNIEDDGSYISTTMDNMFAEWYSRNLSRKINNANKTRMKKGIIVTNGKLWGYDQVNGNLVINEKEAEVVRKVFELYIEGKGFRAISIELDNLGIKNQKGEAFALTTLKRMIRNEKYKGTLICGKKHKNFFTKGFEEVSPDLWIVHENRIPPIVSEEVWNEANRLLWQKRKKYDIDRRSKIAGYYSGSYELSGKIVCGKCGSPFYHSTRKLGPYGNKTTVGIWQCSRYRKFGRTHENGCDSVFIYEEDLKGLLKRQIFELWENRGELIQQLTETLGSVLSQFDVSSQNGEKIRAEIDKLKKRKDQLIDLVADGLITKDDFKRKTEFINRSIDEIEKQLMNISRVEPDIDLSQDRLIAIKEFFEKVFIDESGINDDVLQAFVEKIIVQGNDKIEVQFNGLQDLSEIDMQPSPLKVHN